MKKGLILLLTTIIIISCNTQKKALNSWVGSTKQNLYLSWGPPARTTEDGSGGEILIYGRQVYAPQLGLNYWEYKMMYAHADGIIYHWRLSRQQVPPTQIDVRFIN